MLCPLHILLLEDNDQDAELIQYVLLKEIAEVKFSVATNKQEYLHSLNTDHPDVILADNSLPQFSATEALMIMRQLAEPVPFILVTGTVSEEFAAGIIKLGADDYILKDRISRLPAAIDAAIRHGIAEKEKQRFQKEVLQMNAELRLLSSHLQMIREEERIHIAREIHDELGQQLTGLKMDMHWLRKKIADPSQLPSILEKIQNAEILIDDTIRSVRRISSDLRPPMLDDLGLVAALEWHGQQVEKRSEIEVQFSSAVPEIHLTIEMATGLFRIYQEVLTNAVRHANAHRIISRLELTGTEVKLSIKDDGRGMDVTAVTTGKTYGLLGIKERVSILGGQLLFTTRPGKGTEIIVTVPIQTL